MWQKVIPLNNWKRSGRIAPGGDAVQIKRRYFAEDRDPGPEPLRCDRPAEAAGGSGVCIGRFLQKRWGHGGYVH